MVGFSDVESLSAHQKLIAGCSSGVITRFLTQPLDVIKLRTQLQKRNEPGRRLWLVTTKKILLEEGFTAFWSGHCLGQVHSIISITSQFYIYELTSQYMHKFQTDKSNLTPLNAFFCGTFAGCASTVLVVPVEVVRMRQMMIKDQYRGLWRGAREVYRTGGWLSFYSGLSASWFQIGPAVGISFTVFSILQPVILRYLSNCHGHDCAHAPGNPHRPEYLVIASTIAGSAAGFTSKSLTYPFDLAKRRLQIAGHKERKGFKVTSTSKDLFKCHSLMKCLMDTYQAEGCRGLYRGWNITVYKAQLTSIITFTTYELVCYIIREYNRHAD